MMEASFGSAICSGYIYGGPDAVSVILDWDMFFEVE